MKLIIKRLGLAVLLGLLVVNLYAICVPGWVSAQPPAINDSSQDQGQNTGPGQRPGQPVDLTTAAATLGVTEDALKAALGDGSTRPDLTAAAATLGVTVDALASALGIPKQSPISNNQDKKPVDLATAAATLGVTEEALKTALGDGSTRPDLTIVAATLGVTVDALANALGIPKNASPGSSGPPNNSSSNGPSNSSGTSGITAASQNSGSSSASGSTSRPAPPSGGFGPGRGR
jgi:hypothetical protein